MKKNYELKFRYLPYLSIEDVKFYLIEGYQVIVHQTFSLSENTGHNRVVIGFSDKKGIFIVNDPSRLGPNYELKYADFKKLWANITNFEDGPPNKAYLVMPTSR